MSLRAFWRRERVNDAVQIRRKRKLQADCGSAGAGEDSRLLGTDGFDLYSGSGRRRLSAVGFCNGGESILRIQPNGEHLENGQPRVAYLSWAGRRNVPDGGGADIDVRGDHVRAKEQCDRRACKRVALQA